MADSPPYDDLLSQREASSLLDGNRAEDCRALACGLAGPAIVTPGRHLYRRDAVERLARREAVDLDELAAVTPGVIVLRVPRSLPPAAVRDTECLAAWASGPWHPALPLRVLLEAVVPQRIATVLCVGRYVIATYDVVALDSRPDGFRLRPGSAGAWTAAASERTWAMGPGGRTMRYLNLRHPHRRWWA